MALGRAPLPYRSSAVFLIFAAEPYKPASTSTQLPLGPSEPFTKYKFTNTIFCPITPSATVYKLSFFPTVRLLYLSSIIHFWRFAEIKINCLRGRQCCVHFLCRAQNWCLYP